MGLFGKKKIEEKKDNKNVAKSQESKPKMKDLYGGKTKAKTSKAAAVKTKEIVSAKKPGNAYRHLVKPLITEKAANLSAEGKYAFEVSIKSNKIEVAKAIEEVYGVMPEAVNIIRMSGKQVRYGRLNGRRRDWKKAIVTLPKGKTINIYEGV